jgi:hypothetical protein
MVEEEWKIGDEFIVMSNLQGRYLKIGDVGMCYGHTELWQSSNCPAIFFDKQKTKSIHLDRIEKINRIYELW